MASLDGYKQYITGATGSQGALAPQASWRAFVLPRGAHASQASSGTLITFDSSDAASRFPTNYFIQAGLNTSNIRQITAAGGNSIAVNTSLSVGAGDRIFLIGTTEPVVSGNSTTYQPHTTIYSRDDSASTPVTNSMLTSDANGGFEFFAAPNFFDLIIQDSNRTNQTFIADVGIGAFTGITTSGISVSDVAVIGGTLTVGGELRLTRDIVDLPDGDLDGYVVLRVGGRAQSTGDNRTLGYFSETFDNDITDLNDRGETVGVYAINVYRGNIASGAEAIAVQGEVQYSPTTAKTATASISGAQFFARHGGTHPSAAANIMRGLGTRFITSTGSTGTVTNARGLEVIQPSNQGTVAITNYIGLYVQGASANFSSSGNNVAVFSSGDNSNTFRIGGSPVRIDDSFNEANSATAGRHVDIFKTVVGDSQLSTLNVGVHTQIGVSGTFVSGDDVMGYRSSVRTDTTSGAGKNVDQMSGYVAALDHRSNQLVDEVYGFQANVTASGTSANPIVNTMAGLDVNLAATGVSVVNVYGAVMRSLTPAAGYSSAGHLRLVPVSTATPATTLALMAGAQDGTIIYLTDSNNADNSGLYFRINSKWLCLVSGQSDFRIATDV